LSARVARGSPAEAHHGVEAGTGQHLREPERIEPELIEPWDKLRERLRRAGPATRSDTNSDLHAQSLPAWWIVIVTSCSQVSRTRRILLHPRARCGLASPAVMAYRPVVIVHLIDGTY